MPDTPEYQLACLREREHILEPLVRAGGAWPEVMAIIAECSEDDAARVRLGEVFGFDDVQAQAVLDMQLRRLSVTGRTRLQDELQSLRAAASELGAAGVSAPVLVPAGSPRASSPEYVVEMTAHVGDEESGGLPSGVTLSTKGTSLLFEVTLQAGTPDDAVAAARQAAIRFSAELVDLLSSGDLEFHDDASWTGYV